MIISTPRGRAWLAGLALSASLLAVPASSHAFTSTPLWNCRATALYTSLAGNDRIEPIVANGNGSDTKATSPDREQCANSGAGEENLATPVGIPQTFIAAKTATAKTTITPALGRAIEQKVVSTARVENLSLPLGGTAVVIGVGAANSEATGSCQGGVPKLAGTSSMADLTLGGQPISLNELLGGLQKVLAPLGALADVKFNEQVTEGGALIVRAAHIKMLRGDMTPLLDVVLAESKVTGDSAICDPNKQIPGLSGQICPSGSTYDPASGVCFITVGGGGGTGTGTGGTGTGGTGTGGTGGTGAGVPGPGGTNTGSGSNAGDVIVVGKPFQGPSGGTVISLADALKKYGKLKCLTGGGPKFAIVGTSGKNRITGSNGDDRIIGLAGNDSLDGGRGVDCVEGDGGNDTINGGIGSDKLYGGAGNDTMTGGLGNDVMDGAAGNDKVNGGSGADTLTGGTGADIINAGFGADKVSAGSGNDIVNVAVQGPKARVNCGSGRDRIRLNQVERRSVKGCETQYILKDNKKKS